MNEQPEALSLADYLDLPHVGQHRSAAELRRHRQSNRGGRSMRVTDESAEQLRAWLNENHRIYLRWPITDEQLAYWLTDAESDGSGVMELGSLYSITGAPMTFRVRFEEGE